MTKSQRWVLAGLGGSLAGLLALSCSSNSSDDKPTSPGADGGPDSTTSVHEGGATSDAAPAEDAPETDAMAKPDSIADGGSCVAFDASALDEASVAAGFEQVWQVYRCYGCHQPSSQMVSDAGAGILLSGNNAGLGDSGTLFPPNLTSDPTTGLGCWTDPQIMDAILNGIDNEGQALCKPMPKFGEAMSNPDGSAKAGYPMDASTAQQIVDYLRSLPVVVNQVHDTTCSVADAGPDAAGGPSDAAPAADAASAADAAPAADAAEQ